MNRPILMLFALLVIFSGFSFSKTFGEIGQNDAFILEGSGFAVTEDIIKLSEIDIVLSTQKQSGSTISSSVEDGFVTLDDQDFIITNLQATFLREGKYVRVNGIAEDDLGNEVSIRFFGKLIEESKSASIYGFTGRIITQDDSYKIIYTTKLSTLAKIEPILESKTQGKQITIHILKGSSSQGVASNYIGGFSSDSLRYFSQDRISIEPGTSITIVNDDVVSHSILSGKENYGDRYNQFTSDNRISSGEILPGKSVTIKLEEAGFYRLYDPNYQWMKIVAYVFPNVDSLVLGQGKNPN